MIGFFTPIIPNSDQSENYSLLRGCDHYFSPLSFSGRSVKVLAHDQLKNETLVETVDTPDESFWITALKIISYFSLVIPLLALIGKWVYRSGNTFILKESQPSTGSTTQPPSTSQPDQPPSTPPADNPANPNPANSNPGNRTGSGLTGHAYTVKNHARFDFTINVSANPDYDF
jgi:hypothetical protein